MKKTVTTLLLSTLLISQGCAGGLKEKIMNETDKIRQTEKLNKIMLNTARARWINSGTITWELPHNKESLKLFKAFLYYSPEGMIKLNQNKIEGGKKIELRLDGIVNQEDNIYQKYPYLNGHLKINTGSLLKQGIKLDSLLKSQLVIAITDINNNLIDATQLQTYGVLDDLYTYTGNDLGVSFSKEKEPVLKLWAPTANSVKVHIFN